MKRNRLVLLVGSLVALCVVALCVVGVGVGVGGWRFLNRASFRVQLLTEPLDGSVTDWKTAEPEPHSLDRAHLAKAIRNANRLSHFKALLVIRDGQLIVDRYFHGQQPETLFQLRSLTKNVVSALVGIGVEDATLPDLSVPMATYFPDASADDFTPMTLQHVMNMSGGCISESQRTE